MSRNRAQTHRAELGLTPLQQGLLGGLRVVSQQARFRVFSMAVSGKTSASLAVVPLADGRR
ncbi:hypothetical protein [Methylomonas albis]|nr:hypothetical protein [Methylomonas albis]